MIEFYKNKLKIDELVKKFGEKETRSYLRKHFQKPESYYQFKQIFSSHLQDESPPFHEEMASKVLYNLFKDRKAGTRFGIGAPRGFAKSTEFNLFFLAWCAVNGYYHFILQISDTHTQAKLLLGALKSEFESNELLKWIYPNLQGRVWGEEVIIVNSLQGEVMILPLGAGMKVRGLKFKQYRPQLAIIDDLENSEMVYSSDRRRKLKSWLDNDFEPAFDRYNKNIIYIGTILHYNSLLKQVLDNKDKYKSWVTMLYTAITKAGKSLWEKRFSLDYLLAIRDDPEHPDYVGSIVFAQEYMNNPQDDKDRIIKLEWIKDYNFRREMLEASGDDEEQKKQNYIRNNFTLRFMGVDPAISEKEKADFFACYVAGLEKNTLFEKMFDLVHTKEPDINKQVTIICDLVEEWQVDVLGIESVAYQKGLYTLVRNELQSRGIYIKIKPIATDKDKIRRARIHSSAFEAGFILLRTDHPQYSIIKTEIEEFPLGEHDDAFDSLMLSRETRAKPTQARVFKKKPAGL